MTTYHNMLIVRRLVCKERQLLSAECFSRGKETARTKTSKKHSTKEKI